MLASRPRRVHYKYAPNIQHVTIFRPVPLTQAQRHRLLNLARDGLLARLAGGGSRDAGVAGAAEAAATAAGEAGGVAGEDLDAPTDAELTTPAGCFVSLHEKVTHRLRGCVGRLDPEMPLWRVVRETAGDVLRDPRFTNAPVTADEIPSLELE